jgi:hypothetical protein
MVSEIRKAVVEELRGALALSRPEPIPFPPPNDVSAEDQLLHLALTNALEIACGSLLASEFFSLLNAQLWTACDAVQQRGERPSIPALSAELEAAGLVVTETMKVQMEELWIPFTLEGTPSQLAERVREKARARKLIDWMGRMELELRTGVSSSGDVRNKMARWVKGVTDVKPEGGHGPGVRDSRVRDVA